MVQLNLVMKILVQLKEQEGLAVLIEPVNRLLAENSELIYKHLNTLI